MAKTLLTTRNGRPAAVLVSPDEFQGWKETQAIRSDPALMAEIRRGLRQLGRGAKVYTLEELLPGGMRERVARCAPTDCACRTSSGYSSMGCIPS